MDLTLDATTGAEFTLEFGLPSWRLGTQLRVLGTPEKGLFWMPAYLKFVLNK